MSFPFDPRRNLIRVEAELFGPSGAVVLQLALDTGATRTMINRSQLLWLGYDLTDDSAQVQVTTGSRVEHVQYVTLTRLATLGRAYSDLTVLCHTLPLTASVDGLLGLDFFRGLIFGMG